MLLLGIDVGTSSIKVSVVDAQSQQCIASAQYPDTESGIHVVQPGWAEQSPDMWWEHVKQAILKVNATGLYNPHDISAIGIAYQMHGLVLVDKEQQALRESIIWCDSRAVATGDAAFHAIGEEKCLSHLLNSPGNFTASKLKWVKDHEPALYGSIDKVMLPGDFIAMKLTGNITTSIAALSEGIFWDFVNDTLSEDVFGYYGFDTGLIPAIQPLLSSHGTVRATVAAKLSLKAGTPVTYKAGDQPNNALSLNVLEPGEVAATAGTSGVIYGVSDQLSYDKASRVNSFAHVNYTPDDKRIGILLCINGTGIINRWARDHFGCNNSYAQMNEQAQQVAAGADGLRVLPFGNGAERMLCNRQIGAHLQHIDLNIHTPAHIFRAVQEGIACAFRYGLDIMRDNKMNPSVIRAGRANLFLSNLFAEAFVNTTQVPVELYKNDGSMGAAIGAGLGAGVYASSREAFSNMQRVKIITPGKETDRYNNIYHEWKKLLDEKLS